MRSSNLHTSLPALSRARPARLAVLGATLLGLIGCAALPGEPWFVDRAGAVVGLMAFVGLIWTALALWMMPILADAHTRASGHRVRPTVRLALATAVFVVASTAPALAWWLHVEAIDASVADADMLYAVCEPHHVAEAHGLPVELYRFRGWVAWRHRPWDVGAVYGVPRDGVCPAWQGSYNWSQVARPAHQWLTREDVLGEMLVYTAALQRHGLIEASSIASVSTLVMVCAAAGAAFALLACSLWFPLRRPSHAVPRFGVYAWLANLALVALVLRATLWLTGVVQAPDGGPSAVAAIALAALYAVLLPFIVRRKRYHIAIALTWPLTIGLVLAIPFWLAADVHGGWLGVDPDVWRLPALGTLIAAFALTPLVAAVNERIRAMPD